VRPSATNLAAVAALAVLAVLGFLGAGCGSTKTVARTVTVAQAARLQPDSGTGEQEPLRVGLAGGIKCGVELWPIKTLTDPNAAQVQLDPVLPTSIAAVNALQVPADVTTRQGDNFELHAYQVTAFLIGYKLEADNDWHVVLSDDGSEAQPHTMIVEIPNPACAQPPLEPTTSRVLSQITQARAAFETAFPPAKACFSCNLKTQVTVIGVGFYDRLHGQHGVAVNGAELHPVIGFEVGGAPPPVTTTSSTTTQITTGATTTTQTTTTTATVPTTTAVTTTTVPTPPPTPQHGNGCNLYPGRHWYQHNYHSYCRPYFFLTKYGTR
jgi:hypothetical protein